jgi:hypothetical protein
MQNETLFFVSQKITLKFLSKAGGPTVLSNESMPTRASLAHQLEDQAESLHESQSIVDQK